MLTQAVQPISGSVRTVSFAAQKTALLNSLALVATCGIGAVLSSPAQAASFSGFGCSDNPSCQSYLSIQGGGVSSSAGLWLYGNGSGPSENFEAPYSRVTAAPLAALGVGPANRLFSETIVTDTLRDANGEPFFSYGGTAIAELFGVATLGTLKAAARAQSGTNAFTPKSPEQYSGMGSVANAGASTQLGWGDTITVTSSTHSAGEYIPFELSLYLDLLVTASGKYYGNSQAFVSAGLNVSNGGSLGIFDSNFYPSDTIWKKLTIDLPVGELTSIEGYLEVFSTSFALAYLPDRVLDSDISIADASHTANYFLTPLVDGVSYTSASGRSYFYSSDATPVPTPALLPGLIGLGLNLWRKRRNEVQEKQA
jgi:hypothetical protein